MLIHSCAFSSSFSLVQHFGIEGYCLCFLPGNALAHNSNFKMLTLWHPGGFGNFRKKTQQFSVALPTP